MWEQFALSIRVNESEKVMRHLLFVTALGMSAGLLAPQWVLGQPSSIQDNIEKEKFTLEQLKQEIEKTSKQRDRSRKKHDAVLQSIERLDRRLHKERREAAAINRKLNTIDRELNKMGAQLTTLRSKMNEKKAVVGTRLRRLYMEGQAGWFQPLLTAHSYAEFQYRLRCLSLLATRERRLFEEYQRKEVQKKQLLAQSAKKHESLVVQKGRVDKTMDGIRDLTSQKRVVLASLKKTLLTLDQVENQKDALLKKLDDAAGIKKRTPDSFQRGELLWPAEGDLVGGFGRQRHPMFDTSMNRKGIEIATREGTAILAVSDGDVVYADWLRGYGLVVILDHGNNYFTFYAHASKLLVKEGEAVAQRDVLGKTGSSGLTNRTILYFELRKGTKPVNPLGWLVKR